MVRKHRGIAVAVLTSVATTIAVLLGTPPLLRWLARTGGGDWNTQSAVGQAYGGIAAAIGTLAIGGVAVSLVLQVREAMASRDQLRRRFHVELTLRALDDPDLLECWGTFGDNVREQRQHLYSNQIMSFWIMMYNMGKMSDAEVRSAAADIFGTPAGRRYWAASAPYWRVQYPGKKDRRFVGIVDTEFEKAAGLLISDTAPEATQAPDVSANTPAATVADSHRNASTSADSHGDAARAKLITAASVAGTIGVIAAAHRAGRRRISGRS